MKKRILDVVLLLFCSSVLFIASNINRESFTTESSEIENKIEIKSQWETVMQENAVTEKKIAAAAPILAAKQESIAKVKNENVSQEVTCIQTVTNEVNLYTNRWNIYLTSDEIDLLAKIVWVEARGEPVEGQEAVIEVIFNRMSAPQYPDTLYDVLSQDHPVQFCSWKLRDTATPTEKEYQSIYNVLYGNTNILRNDTMYFSRFQLTPNLDKKICCHCFCYD